MCTLDWAIMPATVIIPSHAFEGAAAAQDSRAPHTCATYRCGVWCLSLPDTRRKTPAPLPQAAYRAQFSDRGMLPHCLTWKNQNGQGGSAFPAHPSASDGASNEAYSNGGADIAGFDPSTKRHFSRMHAAVHGEVSYDRFF